MIRQILVAATMLALVSIASAQTGAYKWTDEDGKTHYSQTPPPETNAIRIEIEPPPASANKPDEKLEQQMEDFDQRREARKESEIEQAAAKDAAKAKEENCRRASDNLEMLERHGQVSLREGDDYRKLTEEERQAKISEAQAQRKEFCEKRANGK